MNIKNLKVNELIPYKNNPRLNDKAVDAVAASIKEFGFKVPIIIDKNNVIVAGHTRLKAAQKLGLEEVPVIIADDLTEDQIKAFRIADNKVSELADWDFSKLEEELRNIQMDMSAFELNMKELSKEFDKNKKVKEDDFNADEVFNEIEEPMVKQGQVWKLGDHHLMCGDSTNEADVEKLMNGVKADLLVTDPPYNVAYEGTAGTIENDDMEDADFREFLRKAFEVANNHLKEGSTFYIWHADSEGYNFRGACHDIGWKVRQCLIWKKSSLVLGRQDYQWIHEPCLYGWKDGAAHNWYNDRSQTTVLNFDKPRHNDLHPTMKPLELIGYQISNSSKQDDVILDLFGGSGSTLIASEQLDRTCYMMELDPKYCDVIIKRFEALTGEKAVLLNA